MTFDANAVVRALFIQPSADVAHVRLVAANAPGELGRVLGGSIEAIDIDGGSVLWMDEEGKNRKRQTNLLATKVAHRLNAGLYPDDTINGPALVIGESIGPHGDLVSADVTQQTLIALTSIGVRIEGLE